MVGPTPLSPHLGRCSRIIKYNNEGEAAVLFIVRIFKSVDVVAGAVCWLTFCPTAHGEWNTFLYGHSTLDTLLHA